MALPVELILEIATLASSSPGSYASLREVSCSFRDIVTSPCLQVVPIILKRSSSARSFCNFLESSPDLALQVQHLWYEPYHSNIIQILEKCTNLVSIACLSNFIAYVCLGSIFRHTRLKEVMLSDQWSSWDNISNTPHVKQLFSQITHLCLLEGVPPSLPVGWFTSLTHFSFSSRLLKGYVQRHLKKLKDAPSLQRIVIISFWFREPSPSAEVLKMTEVDRRLFLPHCHQEWKERDLWLERVAGGLGIWECDLQSKHYPLPVHTTGMDENS